MSIRPVRPSTRQPSKRLMEELDTKYYQAYVQSLDDDSLQALDTETEQEMRTLRRWKREGRYWSERREIELAEDRQIEAIIDAELKARGLI